MAGLNERVGRIAADLIVAATEQSAAHKLLREQGQQLSGQIVTSAENQRQLQSEIDAILATAGQTALDVIALASQQDTLRQVVRSHDDAVNSRMTDLTGGQEQAQSVLDTITATAGQTALDVIDVAARQDALSQDLHSHNKAVAGRIVELANGQQETQSGLDTVIATTGQTALDTIALSDGQVKLARAAQADRQELAARLTGIVQSQQQWSQRLDAAQANAQTIATGIAAIEQHVTKLQSSLQPSLEGLTTQVGATGQSRAQFEAKVNQDIQAVVEAISLLRQQQMSLADQMEQIHKRTQSQTKDIITAIQQLKQPPAEVKVSDSGTKLESSVAEAAAK
jgi:hypothetical protein